MLEVRVENLDEIINKMSTFASKLQRRGVGQAARKAMNIVRDSARTKARQFDDPATPESVIWKNIVTQQGSRRAARQANADLIMRVGVRGGAKDPKTGDPRATFHWRFIEFGTSTIGARPFMLPALAENAQKVSDTFTAELRKAVDRIASTGR
jgi:HK97 gp10 family phage protein